MNPLFVKPAHSINSSHRIRKIPNITPHRNVQKSLNTSRVFMLTHTTWTMTGKALVQMTFRLTLGNG